MNVPAASSGVSAFFLARHSVLDTESSRVFWIPAFAGMPCPRQAAGNEPEGIQKAEASFGELPPKGLEEAVEVCTKLIQIEPNYIFPHLTLAATFADMDKMEEARTEVSEVLRINPKYTVELVLRMFPWKDQVEIDRLIDSLRKARLK